MAGFDPTMTRLGRGPTGAMFSPYGPARDLTRDDAAALSALDRAQKLALDLGVALTEAAAASWAVSDQLQDALGWLDAMRDHEIPAAKRAVTDKED